MPSRPLRLPLVVTLSDSAPPTARLLDKFGAVLASLETKGALSVLEGELPAVNVYKLQQRLPGLTGGEGALETRFSRFTPVRGPFLHRPRTGPDPLERKAYLTDVLGWWGAKGTHD